MLRDNQSLVRRVAILSILSVVLIICLIVYGVRNNPFAQIHPSESYAPLLTNSELLQNWLPPSSYKYTIKTIDNYLQTKRVLASTLTIKGNIVVDESSGGSYDFTILLEPQNQTHNISVTTVNADGLISTSVSIDGQQQGYLVPTSSANGTQYSGLDALITSGLTSLQTQELQAAFQKFAPNPSTITINQNSVILPKTNPNNASLISTYMFLVSINGKDYSSKLNAIGLTQIELFLTNSQTNSQVFDSGVIGQ